MAHLRRTYGDHVADHAKTTVNALPPLSGEQMHRLRALFAGARPGRRSA